MKSFATAAVSLVAAEVLNSCLFFAGVYNSQGMLMFERSVRQLVRDPRCLF